MNLHNLTMSVFDSVAPNYDDHFSDHPIATYLRARTWRRLDALAKPNMRVLELGCGTGHDAEHLTERGVQVVATDASPAMLSETRRKLPNLMTYHLDFNNPDTWGAVEGPFDGVYSNFGALNCATDWPTLARWLTSLIRPQGWLAFGVMSRFCAWESAWCASHGHFSAGARRWRGYQTAQLPDGDSFPVVYPTLREWWQPLRHDFTDYAIYGIGVFLPPSEVYSVVESRPWLFKSLAGLETRWADCWPLRSWGDHFWFEARHA